MKLLLIGSTSQVSTTMVDYLIDMDFELISYSRSHDPRIHEIYDFDSTSLNDIDFDIAIYFLIDYTNIKIKRKFLKDNLDLFNKSISNIGNFRKLILISSDSGFENVKSNYGCLKLQQDKLAENLGCRIIKIGWLESRQPRHQWTSIVLTLMKKFRKFSPNPMVNVIRVTYPSTLISGFVEMTTHDLEYIECFSTEKSFSEFIFGEDVENKYWYIGNILFFIVDKMSFILPSKVVRTIDSARTLM